MIRPRGGTTRRRDDDEEDAASSAEDIGRLLRSKREERGLDLLTVHDRLGRPITQIEALETGDLTGLPDQAMALSTLRRYAAFLGLDGDALALQMIDAWSTTTTVPRSGTAGDVPTSGMPTVVTAITGGPDHLRAFTQTGEVPKVGGGSSGPPTGSGAYGYGMTTGPPTGTFPVVPRQELRQSRRSVARARRQLRAPTSLKVITWVLVGLLIVAIGGLVVYRTKPTWLAQAHILRVSRPGGTRPAVARPAARPATGGSTVSQTASGAASASYAVSATHFVVVVATSGRCWVQVTSSNSSVPLISGVQAAGTTLRYPANGTMTVEVGSSAVLTGITVGKKPVFLNAPSAVPFTYTFAPTSSS